MNDSREDPKARREATAVRVDRRRTRPPSPFPDDIFIPEDVKHIPFETWPRLSVRLLNILGHQGYTVFGDLHGLKLSRLARLRSCGSKSITELGRAIQRVQRRSATRYVPPAASSSSARASLPAPKLSKLNRS